MTWGRRRQPRLLGRPLHLCSMLCGAGRRQQGGSVCVGDIGAVSTRGAVQRLRARKGCLEGKAKHWQSDKNTHIYRTWRKLGDSWGISGVCWLMLVDVGWYIIYYGEHVRKSTCLQCSEDCWDPPLYSHELCCDLTQGPAGAGGVQA